MSKQDMRQPTEQEAMTYKYLVNLTIDVRRTDNEMLTDDENAMVQKMKLAVEETIAKVMADNGQNTMKNLGSETRIY